MIIKNMFEYDIDRPINGVVQVNQDDEKSLEQELSEYVITTELRRHFDTFFDSYSKSFDTPTNNVGVWISGFYGSGKSHFLKMLSYLLANKEVVGKKPIDYFENKFDDPMVYATMKKCIDNPTETILFEIAKATVGAKNDASIVRAIAKVFYNHLGYFGDDLKIVKLERYIEKQNKAEEFKQLFEEINGDAWLNARDTFAFFEDDITEVLTRVLDISETAARNWFNGEETSDISIDRLAEDIDEYIQSKEENFRLLFMIDEVGQYINTDVNLKLSLQAIVEKIGSTSRGKAWVVVTSQEAIDTFAKHSEMDFSGILGRFNTKLSLTSSSADEVIKKRILKKSKPAEEILTMNYETDSSMLSNILKFSEDCVMDLKGFRDEFEYVSTYPFVPYQFTVIQKVFDAVREKGIASKHQSSGERSLLECYQIAAQKVKDKDDNTLVPFYFFYDTVSNALDTTIRRVIDRCQKAAINGDGIEKEDVDVLKLLYLIRYIEDIPSNIENIANLMIDDVRVDKINLRENVKLSLERLIRSNYVSRTGDKYNFLTDEEQDIARDIRRTDVGAPDIRTSIAQTVFGEIFPMQKFKFGKYDFDFDKYVDDTISGASNGGIRLRIVTDAGDLAEAPEEKLIMDSHANKEVIVILSSETPYYDEIEQAMKIRKFVKKKNINDMSDTAQEIIRSHQSEAKKLDKRAKGYIENAILNGTIYVHGEKIEIQSDTAQEKLNGALKYLVESVYSKLPMITNFVESDADVLKILNEPMSDISIMKGIGINNEEALNEIGQWLEVQNQKMMPTSMGDLQRRFKNIPFGWREIDIAAVVARLITEQKIEIRYGGVMVEKTDRRLVDYLRKKSEIDKANVIRHVPVDEALIRKVIAFLREYLGSMGIPNDEAGLIDYVIENFNRKQEHYNVLLKEYDNKGYPQKDLLISARDLMSDILTQRKDNVALLNRILSKQDDLINMTEDTEDVETFFRAQKEIFDKAISKVAEYNKEQVYLANDIGASVNLRTINEILVLQKPYSRIKELPVLLSEIEETYIKLLDLKREEVENIINQCKKDISTIADNEESVKDVVAKSEEDLFTKCKEVHNATSLIVLDAMIMQLQNYKDNVCRQIEVILNPVEVEPDRPASKKATVKRFDLCPAKTLQNNEEIDRYVEDLRKKLYEALEGNDSVQIN